ncbi:hypothetical protein RYH80_00220 [Halobaculum sp. MBLA0147]|uniref:hypothetical protein n=1 Tax=Halobaculum sp. MBLA0147 TaxID=3079934 RepID=UPI0035234625
MSYAESLLSPAAGSYLATVLVPAAVVASVASGGAVPSLAVLATAWVAVALVGGLAATGVSDLHEVVGTAEWGGLLTVAPLGYLAYLLAADPGPPLGLLGVLGLAGSGLGVVVATLGLAVRNRRRRADATDLLSVTVGDAEDGTSLSVPSWAPILAGVAMFATVIVGVFALEAVEFDFPTGVFTAIGGLGTLVTALADDETELTVTDEGIVTDDWLRPAETLADYELTDEELRIERGGMHPNLSFDCADLDDDERDRLRDALDRVVGDESTTTGAERVETDHTASDTGRERERERAS